MWSHPIHVFKPSNRQDPFDCETNEESDVDTSKTLEPPFETSIIEDFDPNSSDHHDLSGHEAKESEAKANDSVSNETEPPFNSPPPKISFKHLTSEDSSIVSSNGEPTMNSIFKSSLKKPTQLDLPFIDPLHGGSTSNETS